VKNAATGCGCFTILLGLFLSASLFALPFGIPILVIGFLILLSRNKAKTTEVDCPTCNQINIIEKTVKVYVCPHCENPTKLLDNGKWISI